MNQWSFSQGVGYQNWLEVVHRPGRGRMRWVRTAIAAGVVAVEGKDHRVPVDPWALLPSVGVKPNQIPPAPFCAIMPW